MYKLRIYLCTHYLVYLFANWKLKTDNLTSVNLFDAETEIFLKK